MNEKAETYLRMIKDAYRRMGTNRDIAYRVKQLQRVNEWLEELSKLYESGAWNPADDDV